MDFPPDMRLCGLMDTRTDLAPALLCVAGAMLEEAAALAPLSDGADLTGRIDLIETLIDNAGCVVRAARIIAKQERLQI